MMRYAAWTFLLLLSSTIAALPARADHGGMHQGFRGGHERHEAFERHEGRERFEHRHRFFHHHVFFRPFFFFGRSVFAPLPIALFAPPAYPAYLMGPVDGAPYCYVYQTTIVIGGQLQPAYGTACLGPDGYWRIVQ